MRGAHLAGVAAITVTSVLWGTTGTAATFAPEAGPLAIGSAALGIGGLLQAAVAVRPLRAAASALRTHLALVLLGAFAVMVYPLAFYSSMQLAGVAIGSVVSLASAPLASGLLERLVEHRPLSAWWMVAAGLGIVGAIMLCTSTLHEAIAPATSAVGGILLGLVAGATYATYSWIAQRLMRAGIGRAAAMGAVFGTGGTLLMPVLIATGAPLLATTDALLVTGYMALVPMFAGYLLFGYGLARVPASTATSITLSEPAVATVLAVVVLGERLTVMGWAGLGIIGAVLLILAFAPTNASAGKGPSLRRARARSATASRARDKVEDRQQERGVACSPNSCVTRRSRSPGWP